MAVTVLKHLKEAKSKNKAQHLKNAIKYIFNPKKTENGLYCGSNCGSTVKEIYDEMMETKTILRKEDGRQGYHFVISFPPGECNEDTAFALGKDFCETYLKDYEYAYSVHNDHDHMHCHIIFNSVSKGTGLKYRYKNGDWEKSIQPVTDMLCAKNGLSGLSYEKDGERIGKSYAERDAIKRGGVTKSDIVRADINFAILEAKDFEGFLKLMDSMGYSIRRGHSKKQGKDYLSYTPPIKGARAHRDYKLGNGYLMEDIKRRINEKYDEEPTKMRPDIFRYVIIRPTNLFQLSFIYRYRQANNYLFFRIDYGEQVRVRNDLLSIERIAEDTTFILDNDLRSEGDVQNRLSDVEKKIKELNHIRYSEKAMSKTLTEGERTVRKEYEKLSAFIRSPDITDEEFEKTADRLEELEALIPKEVIRPLTKTDEELLELKNERKILKHILKELTVTLDVRDVPMREMPTIPVKPKAKESPVSSIEKKVDKEPLEEYRKEIETPDLKKKEAPQEPPVDAKAKEEHLQNHIDTTVITTKPGGNL